MKNELSLSVSGQNSSPEPCRNWGILQSFEGYFFFFFLEMPLVLKIGKNHEKVSIVVQTWEKKTAMMQQWQGIPPRSLSPVCSLHYAATAFMCVLVRTGALRELVKHHCRCERALGTKDIPVGGAQIHDGTTATGRGGEAEGRKHGEDTVMRGCLTLRHNQNKQDHHLSCLSLSR